MIQSLIESGENCQVIALCGTNVRDFNELERSCSQSNKVKVVPLKTINDSQMADFLKIVDCVFARPGAGSSTEALVSGCPIIFDLSKGIMPQETNNLNYSFSLVNDVALMRTLWVEIYMQNLLSCTCWSFLIQSHPLSTSDKQKRTK